MNHDQRTQAELIILAGKLDELMAERVVSQAKLARLMQTNRATVCRLLQGSDAKMSTYLRAFEVLGVDMVILPRVA